MLSKYIAVAVSGLLLTGVHALPKPDPVAEPAPQITIPLPGGGSIVIGKPSSTLIPIGKRQGIEELGDVSSTITWTGEAEKREAQELGDVSTTITWTGDAEKREPQELGTVSSTTTWEGDADPAALQLTGKSKRVADPQISLGAPTGTITWDSPTPAPSACACASGTAPGKYCGYCDAIEGSWVSWNAYRCYANGSCKSLGFTKACVDGTPSQCPSIIFT